MTQLLPRSRGARIAAELSVVCLGALAGGGLANAASPGVVFNGTSRLSNDHRYDYTFSYRLAITGSVKTTISGDTPGQVTLVLPVVGVLTEKNTTPGGYAAPSPVRFGDFTAFWQASNPVCKAPARTLYSVVNVPLGPLKQVRLRTSHGFSDFCYLNLVEEDAHAGSFISGTPSGLNEDPSPGEQWVAVIPTHSLKVFRKALAPGGADLYGFTTPNPVGGKGIACTTTTTAGLADLSFTILKTTPTATC